MNVTITGLEAGGCARDQRTTQWCAEASDCRAELERLRAAVREYFDAQYDAVLGHPVIMDDEKRERYEDAEESLRALVAPEGKK